MKKTALLVLAIAAAYALLGLAGLQLSDPPGNVTSVWLPSGVGLAALLLWGRRVWPGIFLGSLWCNVVVFPGEASLGWRLASAAVIAGGSTLGLLSMHALLDRFVGRCAFSSPVRLVRLLGCVLVGAAIPSSIGLAVTAAHGLVAAPLAFWLTWWTGDSIGVLLVAPLVLSEGVSVPSRRVEWLVTLAAQLVVVQLVFGRPIGGLGGTHLPMAGLVLPMTVWAGARLGTRGVAVHALLLHALVTWATRGGAGPFGAHPTAAATVIVDVLVAIVFMTGLVLAAGAAELRNHQHLLEERVRERTAELERANQLLRAETEDKARLAAQLVESQKQEAIGRLAGGIAHDFNNLLTVIAAESELLRRSQDTEVQDGATAILAATQRANELTRQLLAVARRQPAKPCPVDLRAALTESRRMLRPLMPEDVVLDVECAPDCTVLIDPGQLDQVVLNLALNAQQAIKGAGALRLSGQRRELDAAGAAALGLAPGAWVVLAVRDTGVGIPPEVLPRIFEPFFTTRGDGRGTGLGLSSVWGIVSQAGGTVKVESEPGRGTTFEVWLPWVAQRPELAPPERAPAPVAGGRTVLVAEDEPMVRRTVVRVLERDGLRVVVATDGEEALALCRDPSFHFDLLLTDVVMPRLGGVELAREIRAQRQVPVLFMSGFHDRHAELHDEQVLAKPFLPAQLTAAVAGALKRGA
ncbi:MAG: MASE1 domain-containing protein [Myxococcota bacterium]